MRIVFYHFQILYKRSMIDTSLRPEHRYVYGILDSDRSLKWY